MSSRNRKLVTENNRLKDEIARLKQALNKSNNTSRNTPASRARNVSAKPSRSNSGYNTTNISSVKTSKRPASSKKPINLSLIVANPKQVRNRRQRSIDYDQDEDYENFTQDHKTLKEVLSDASSENFMIKAESDVSTASKKNLFQELENEFEHKEKALLEAIETLKEENGVLKERLSHSNSQKVKRKSSSNVRSASTPKHLGHRTNSRKSFVLEQVFTPLKAKQCKTCDHLLSIGYSTRYCPKHGHLGT